MIMFMKTYDRYTADELAGERSYRLLPEAWYEKRFRIPLLQVTWMILMYWMTYPQFLFDPPVWLSVVSVGAYFLGWLVDMISTWRMFRLRPAFERNHVPFPFAERSLFVRDSATLLGVLASPGTFIMLVILAVVWLFPAVGLAIVPAQLAAAANNRRKAKRAILHLRLFDELLRTGVEEKALKKTNRPETHSNVMKWPVVNPI